MDAFQTQVNTLLIDIYWNILKVQEDFVRRVGRSDVTLSEMHIIEAVGDITIATDANGDFIDEQRVCCTISDIAGALNITLPSVTVAIKKLSEKDCVDKIRCENDGRVVYVILTKTGMEIYKRHHNFHKRMVEELTKKLTEPEKQAVMKGLTGLNAYFQEKLIQESKN